MNASRRRAIGCLALMAGAAVVARATTPHTKLADSHPPVDLEAMIPQVIGRWHLDATLPVILPAPDVQAQLNAIYNQILARTYINPAGQRVMLSLAYGGDQSDGTSAHRPEVCYPSQGFAIDSNGVGQVDLGGRELPVRRLVARLSERVEPITYWIVVGEGIALSGTQQKLIQLRYGVRGQIPDGMLVRVSSIDRDAASAFGYQDAFINDLLRSVSPQAALRLVGRGERR